MSTPRVVRTRAELRDRLDPSGRTVLVPTMGALHAGHAALLARARTEAGPDGLVVASIFVNPMQFGVGEDLDRYPRTFEADLEMCAREGADVVFAPSVDEVYPGGEPEVTVDPGPLGSELEGESRPGHFRGVLTVVAKLFGLVGPDVAVFGEKDYQQLVLVRRMVRDLCLGVEVVGVPIVREPDGLALSSRNRYLDDDERRAASALSRALAAAADRAGYGEPAARWAGMRVLKGEPGLDIDYFRVTGPDLGPAPERGPGRALVAASAGKTRLIDNLALDLGGGT